MDMATITTTVTTEPSGRHVNSSEHDAGNTPLAQPEFEPAPDGGMQAWLVAAGGGAIYFSCLGFANSYGTFQEYYLTHNLSDRTADDVAWIGSIALFLQFAVALVAGPMFDRFGAKILRPAAVGYVLAIMLLSLCTTYWQIMLVQGVLMGILAGLLEIPVITIITHWFDKKRATVLGLVVSGSSIGGVVVPIATSKMLNTTSLGYGWTLRIIGFFMLPLLVFASVTVKSRIPPHAASFANFWSSEVFKNPKFLILAGASYLIVMGQNTPIFFIPSYAAIRGTEATLAGSLLAILNAASTFGRIIPGILADKYGRINVYVVGGIASGVVIFFMDMVATDTVLVIYSVIFSFWSGTIMSGAPAALSVCSDDLQKMGTYLGMALFIISFGNLIGPPINGVLVERYGGFFQAALFSGSITVFGGLIAIFAKFHTAEGIFGRT
ncbi:monocarboxylate permease-like protein [Hypoxylon crocopeplum]|nr:monocarboxylate permease-like protein [Hypoxylon crocopeplum]